MAVINKNVVAVFGKGLLGRATSAVNFDSQNIPSELYDKFRAVCGLARPVGTTQRRYPWRIKQPGTPQQVDVWDKFLYCTRCFEEQTPEQREEWYNQSIGSGLFYYTYFMNQTLPIVHQGLIPGWCTPPWDVCYFARVMPTEAVPPWDFIGDDSNCSIADEILTVKNVLSQYCFWQQLNMLSIVKESIVEARIKGVTLSTELGKSQAFLRMSGGIGVKSASLSILADGVKPTPGTKIYMDTTDKFHTYKFSIKGTSRTLYIDGAFAQTTPLQWAGFNGIYFGVGGSYSQDCESQWDYVCYYTAR